MYGAVVEAIRLSGKGGPAGGRLGGSLDPAMPLKLFQIRPGLKIWNGLGLPSTGELKPDCCSVGQAGGPSERVATPIHKTDMRICYRNDSKML